MAARLAERDQPSDLTSVMYRFMPSASVQPPGWTFWTLLHSLESLARLQLIHSSEQSVTSVAQRQPCDMVLLVQQLTSLTTTYMHCILQPWWSPRYVSYLITTPWNRTVLNAAQLFKWVCYLWSAVSTVRTSENHVMNLLQ